MYNRNMKLLKKLFYTIMIFIMLGCAGVLFLALSPDMTQSLSHMLYGEAGPEAYGNAVSDADEDPEPSDIMGDSSGIASGVLASDGTAGYVAPLRGSFNLPERVSGKNGYVPVKGDGEELADELADTLGAQLNAGATGDGLSFDAEMYPYYHMLNEKMQHIYRQIYANALAVNASFAPVESVNIAQLKNVFEAVCNDHPELFWLETSYSCKYRPSGQCVEMTLEYNRTAKALDQSKADFEAAAKKILDGARNQSDEYEKEKYVHDELIKKADYAVSSSMNQSAYSALVNGDTVCAGYTRAFQYLMQQLGIPCYCCTGYSGEEHAWNIVRVDGEYYNVDATWDDADPVSYDYFNKTDADFVGTHVRTGLSIYLPACGWENGSADNGTNIALGNTVSGITLNPNPQQPLTWQPKHRVSHDGDDVYDLDEAGLTQEMVENSLKEYYEDCLAQMVDKGSGQQTFSNYVSKKVLKEVERSYGTGDYQKGYVEEGLKKLEKENFAIQIQVEDIGGNYYRLYHNISTW